MKLTKKETIAIRNWFDNTSILKMIWLKICFLIQGHTLIISINEEYYKND